MRKHLYLLKDVVEKPRHEQIMWKLTKARKGFYIIGTEKYIKISERWGRSTAGSFFIWKEKDVVLWFSADDEIFGFNPSRRESYKNFDKILSYLHFSKYSTGCHEERTKVGRFCWKQLQYYLQDATEFGPGRLQWIWRRYFECNT